jgi:uncharacterized membrane protein YhiD involved in acid resistance
MLDILTIQTSSSHPALVTILYSVLLAFLLSTLIAVTYEKTFRGLSYSRNFVQAIFLGSIVAATVMQAVGNSLAAGIGMLGALAIIRFRTGLRDPRDIIFIFSSLAAGIACGVGGYSIAIVGTLVFCSIAFALYFTPLGSANQFDGMLRFSVDNSSELQNRLTEILKKHCRVFALVTLRDMAQGKRLDCAYHIKLRREGGNAELVAALNGITSIQGVNIMLQDNTVEL